MVIIIFAILLIPLCYVKVIVLVGCSCEWLSFAPADRMNFFKNIILYI